MTGLYLYFSMLEEARTNGNVAEARIAWKKKQKKKNLLTF